MSRCLTLEQYLEEFVDENTKPTEGDLKVLITNEEAQTLGFFFLNGIAGLVECVRIQRGNARSDVDRVADEMDQEEFIN